MVAEVVRGGEDLELVGAARDAAEAVRLTKLHRPDVAVLDVNMPGGGGPTATREIGVVSPETRVVALSAFDDRGAVLEMLGAGATGYVVKGASVEEILEGIRRAARGEAPLSSEVAADVIHELQGRLRREAGEAEHRSQATKRIRSVLDGTMLAVVLQPIFDLRDESIVGAEALSRFGSEPRRGPDKWFAEAASIGLGLDLEVKAVEAALEHLQLIPTEAYLSLNVSPETVGSGRLIPALGTVAFGRLVVEITEHAPVADYEALANALQDFRSAGGRLAIDDVGAGFASLRHIVRLAPDIIKLDISLTHDIHVDLTRRAMATALISFARETETCILAEGVETQEELDTLRELGVAQAQGYYLARPVPPQAIASVGAFGSSTPSLWETA